MHPVTSLFATLSVFYFLALYLGKALRQKLFLKQTGVADLNTLGQARSDHEKIKGTVVVCGGRSVVFRLIMR
jgi:hypothetical protein